MLTATLERALDGPVTGPVTVWSRDGVPAALHCRRLPIDRCVRPAFRMVSEALPQGALPPPGNTGRLEQWSIA